MVINKCYVRCLLLVFSLLIIGPSFAKNEANNGNVSDEMAKQFKQVNLIKVRYIEKKRYISIRIPVENVVKLSQMILKLGPNKVISVPIKSHIIEGHYHWGIASTGVKYDSFKFNFLIKTKTGKNWFSSFTAEKTEDKNNPWKLKLITHEEW
jgi:N-dimethylarginine dimethylaminohydrolase